MGELPESLVLEGETPPFWSWDAKAESRLSETIRFQKSGSRRMGPDWAVAREVEFGLAVIVVANGGGASR